MTSLFRLFRREPSGKGFVLALGGGGGRGLAHLGVIQALEERDLTPSAIVGTSIGALFGAMYALTPDIRYVRERVQSFLRSDAFSDMKLPVLHEAETQEQTWLGRLMAAARHSVLYTRAATGVGLVDVNVLIDVARTLCANSGFADARIPLFVTAVHFPSGECRVFSQGDLVRAVAASMAMPGVFEPVELDGQRFVDGGVASELPAREAKMVAKRNQIILAVNVGTRPRPDVEPEHVIGMLDWAFRTKSFYLREYKKEFADIVLEPLVHYRQWSDFSRPDEEIECGYRAARERMADLLKSLRA